MKRPNSMSNHLLFENGWQVISNGFGSDVVDIMVRNYNLFQSSFLSHSGNISFPFYSSFLHEFLTTSNVWKTISSYFNFRNRNPPVLQTIPSVIITYPNLNQLNFNLNEHRFPAIWHTDYNNEFVIMLPLCDIDISTPHTKYLQGSSLDKNILPQTIYKEEEAKSLMKKHQPVDCFAKKGDAILIDVTGVHRGELKQAFRIMIQVKFTCGNDILIFDENNPKFLKSLKALKENIVDYQNVINSIQDSLTFISKTNFEKQLCVIPDSISTFEAFLN